MAVLVLLHVQKASVCTANNDILVFLVGLGESGTESGLGISVKGKTSVSDSCYRDLGLYVKSILDGGAGAKVYTNSFIVYHLRYEKVLQYCYVMQVSIRNPKKFSESTKSI